MALVGWIFIALLIFLAMALVFKFQDVLFVFSLIKKYMFVVLMISIVLFFTFSLNFIHNSYSVDLTTGEGIVKAGQVYLFWMKDFVVNLGKVTGYVANQEWGLNKTSSFLGN